MKPLPGFNGVSTVCYRRIVKGAQDVAEVGAHHKQPTSQGQPATHIVTDLAKGNTKPAPGKWPNHKHSELSVEAEAGLAVYMIELDSSTRARFGPGAYPIQLLPLTLTGSLLRDVGLLYTTPAGELVFVEADDIAAQYGSIPANAILTFSCDRKDLENAWTQIVINAGHAGKDIEIPFFLNLYDTKTGLPVWTYGNWHPVHTIDHDDGHSHDGGRNCDDKSDVRIHGGIHPSSAVQLLY